MHKTLMISVGTGEVERTRKPSSAIVSDRFTKMDATPNSDFLRAANMYIRAKFPKRSKILRKEESETIHGHLYELGGRH